MQGSPSQWAKKWAIQNGYWFERDDSLGEFSDRGSENEVYMDYDNQTVNKLNDFRYADDNLDSFFQRIKIHNDLLLIALMSFVVLQKIKTEVYVLFFLSLLYEQTVRLQLRRSLEH